MPVDWSSDKETSFRQWYKGHSKKLKLSPDPDDPKHYYDYRGAYKAGAGPDKTGHWPSKYKKKGHPTYHLKFGVPK